MNIEVKFDDKTIDNRYNKNNKFIYYLYNNLLYRLNKDIKLEILLDNFRKSNEVNLKDYINKHIFEILLDMLKYENFMNNCVINDGLEKILFKDLKELKKKITYFINILG